MANHKSKATLAAEQLCAEFPEASSLSLARRLKKEHPVAYATVERARDVIRYIRGAKGKARAKHATVPKPKGVSGQVPETPPSLAEPWTPFVMDGCKRIGIISDIHVPYHSDQAWTAAMVKLRSNDCDAVLINGDFCDFYRISRFEKEPDARSFADELIKCREGLKSIRDFFPKARIVLKCGNHEERWDHFIWTRAPELYGVDACRIHELLKLSSMGIEIVTDQRTVLLGKLPVLHGHELQKGIAAPVNPARGAFLKTLHSVAVGHSHRTSTHVEPDMFGREIAVWSVGCLCAPNPAYNRFAKSNHGFAYVAVSADGEFNFENYRISSDWKVRTG